MPPSRATPDVAYLVLSSPGGQAGFTRNAVGRTSAVGNPTSARSTTVPSRSLNVLIEGLLVCGRRWKRVARRTESVPRRKSVLGGENSVDVF